MKLKIDDSDSLNFILDSGVSNTIITDPKLMGKLNFKISRRVKIIGLGENEFITAGISVGHILKLNQIVDLHSNIIYLEDDLLKLSEIVGMPIHGIIGYDIFKRFVVTIDYEQQIIAIQEPLSFRYHKNKGELKPIIISHSKPVLQNIEITNLDGLSTKVNLILDSGNSNSLVLNSTKIENKIIPKLTIDDVIGRGLNGNINGKLGRIKKMNIGNQTLHNVLVAFAPENDYLNKIMVDSNLAVAGSIGGEILRRFKATYNYQGGYVCLKPNKKTISNAFEHDMSGLEIAAKGENFDEFYIANILKNSPAAETGLQKNDNIVAFNGISIKEQSLNEIYQSLNHKHGAMTYLTIKRLGYTYYF